MNIETVGSFLPPESLYEARKNHELGRIGFDKLVRTENEAVSDAVRRQLALGLPEVTSGELRRTYWDMDFYFGLGGISNAILKSGRIYQDIETCTDLLRINGGISFNPTHPFFDDYRHLHAVTSGKAVCRQTLPSPANLYLEIMELSDGQPGRIYPEPEKLTQDIASAYRATIIHLYGLGCRSVQFDDTACGRLCQDNYTKRLLQGGTDLLVLHERIINLINDSVKEIPSDMELSIYLSGGDMITPEWEHIEYPDNIMPKILSQANVSKFFMPFDLGNSYQPEVLRHVPSDKKIVLGLIDAHSPYHEPTASIIATINLASEYIAPERLSVSPRTGFKLSSFMSRGLTYEDQWRKLAHLQEILP